MHAVASEVAGPRHLAHTLHGGAITDFQLGSHLFYDDELVHIPQRIYHLFSKYFNLLIIIMRAMQALSPRALSKEKLRDEIARLAAVVAASSTTTTGLSFPTTSDCMHVQPIREAVLSAIDLSVRSARHTGSGNGNADPFCCIFKYKTDKFW